MTLAPLLLAATLLPQLPFSVEPVRVHNGPALLVHRQSSPLVALRLSVPVPVDLPEGTVELLQELARPAAEAAARELGARLELRHEGGRAVIEVAGPDAAFDALVAILRRAISEPSLAVTALRRARARAEDRVLAGLEQPAPRIRRLLRHRLYGGPEPLGAAATRLDPEAIRGLRAYLYARSATLVVLVGSVPDPLVRSAFADWPGGGGIRPVLSQAADMEGARPQAHREWGGIGFEVDADPAALAVVAELIQRRVARSALRYGVVEAWHEPAPALVLVGAATPGDSVVATSAGISDLPVRDAADLPVTDVRRYLRRLVAEAAALAGPAAVVAARTAVRRRLLMEARTAVGKASVIGRVADRSGGEDHAEAFLARLGRVEPAEVRALLTRVLDTPAVVAEGR